MKYIISIRCLLQRWRRRFLSCLSLFIQKTKLAFHMETDFLKLLEAGANEQDVQSALMSGINVDVYDENGLSPVFFNEDVAMQVMHHCYPSSRGWTEEQIKARLQSMYLIHACGLDLKKLSDQPDPAEWVEKYTKYNDVSPQDEAGHVQDMLVAMTRQILIAPLLNKYPSLETQLCNRKIRKQIELELAHSLGKAFFGPISEKNIPLVALPKILLTTKRWDRNRQAIDVGPEEFRLFSVDTVIPKPVQTPNGLWIVPIKTYDDMYDEGVTLSHCLWGHRMACMFDSMNVLCVRYSPHEAAYTAGLKPSKQGYDYIEYSPPLGTMNKAAPEEVVQAWEWFKEELSRGTWGDPKRHIQYAQNRAELREGMVRDILRIVTGYNPRGENGLQEAAKAWGRWTGAMDDLLRYRKLSLREMLQVSGLNNALDTLAKTYGVAEARASQPVPG